MSHMLLTDSIRCDDVNAFKDYVSKKGYSFEYSGEILNFCDIILASLVYHSCFNILEYIISNSDQQIQKYMIVNTVKLSCEYYIVGLFTKYFSLCSGDIDNQHIFLLLRNASRVSVDGSNEIRLALFIYSISHRDRVYDYLSTRGVFSS